MTNKNKTELVLVVDRSGSMATIQDDAQGGINSFIKEQKLAKGEATLTLCQFDTEYEFVEKSTPIQDVKPYKLMPRGGTALNDAIGRTINETGQRLAALPEEERPALVIFLVVTDGEENSSREFTGPQIKEMIEHQKNKYNWNFNFLGTEESSIGTARDLGFQNIAQYKGSNSAQVYKNLSSKYAMARSASASGVSCQEAYALNSITSEDSEEFMK
jgi:uncharacterized protein YegL